MSGREEHTEASQYLEAIQHEQTVTGEDGQTYVVLNSSDLVSEAMFLTGSDSSSVKMTDSSDGSQMEIMVLKDTDSDEQHLSQAELEEYIGNATNNVDETNRVDPSQCCLICNDPFNSSTQDFFDIQSIYIINGTKFSMFEKLQQFLYADLSKTHIQSTQVCRNCFGLIEDANMMEQKILSIKENLLKKFQQTVAQYGAEIVLPETYQCNNTNSDENGQNQKEVTKPQKKKSRRKSVLIERDESNNASVTSPIYSGTEEFNCPKCKKIYMRQDFKEFVNHVKVTCGMTKSVICYDCGKVFRNKSSLMGHRRVEHKIKKPVKELSDTEPEDEIGQQNVSETITSEQETSAEEPMQVHVEIQECADTNQTTNTRASKRHSAASSLKDEYQNVEITVIPVKEEISSDENGDIDLESIERGHFLHPKRRSYKTQEVVYHCAGCNLHFNNKSKFTYHIRTKHKQDLVVENITNSKCSKCMKPIPITSDPAKHVCRWYVCEVCKIQCTSKPQLRAHLLTHTNYRPYQCPQCVKTFTRKEYLTIHLRVHNDERPYTCDFCAKNFRSKTHLNNHRRLHTGEKPYICQHCGMAFPVPQNLHSHLQTHRGIKPMKCDVCNRCFRDMSHLKKHYRVHTGEKPYQCSICGRVFASRSNCQAHERTHTRDIKQWPCTLCGKGFPRKAKLRDHMLIHEQNDVIIYKTQDVLEGDYDPNTLQLTEHRPTELIPVAYQNKQGQTIETVHEGYNVNDEVIVVQVFSYDDHNDNNATIVSEIH